MCRLILVIVGLMGSAMLPATASLYRSNLADVQWLEQFSLQKCELRQPLGGWGELGFERHSGKGQRIFVVLKNTGPMAGSMRVVAVSPPWSATAGESEVLGRLYLNAGGRAEENDIILSIQGALAEGRRVWLQSVVSPTAENPVTVQIEPLYFRGHLDAYRQCFSSLLPGYEQVRRTSIYFPEDKASLPAGETEKLVQLTRFLVHSPGIKSVFIDGHTDNIGSAVDNLALSKARAQWVAAYFADKGIDKERLMIRWHGEKYPVVSNRDAAGRDRNRRVTIRLER